MLRIGVFGESNVLMNPTNFIDMEETDGNFHSGYYFYFSQGFTWKIISNQNWYSA